MTQPTPAARLTASGYLGALCTGCGAAIRYESVYGEIGDRLCLTCERRQRKEDQARFAAETATVLACPACKPWDPCSEHELLYDTEMEEARQAKTA